MKRIISGPWSFERIGVGFIVICVAIMYLLAAMSQPFASFVSFERNSNPLASVTGLGTATEVTIEKPVTVMVIETSDKLSAIFERIGYRLEDVRRHGEVPRLFLASLPIDLPDIAVADQRKRVFLRTTLPLILHVNELILSERRRLIALRLRVQAGGALSEVDRASVTALAERYDAPPGDFDRLLARVDIIPASLALAQAAEESGWGTSRFAQKGKALFGQRTFKGRKGLTPKLRDKGKTYRVRAFDHLIDGVKSYVHNLNIHPAYKNFRRNRSAMRRAGTEPQGIRLAESLLKYSERGAAYVRSIKTIIRSNRLTQLDKARLGDNVSTNPFFPDA